MTEENRNRDGLDKAISAMRADQPAAEQVHAAADRVWMRMQSDLKDAGMPIRGCAEIQQLLPAMNAGQLSTARALIVTNHLHECVDCRRAASATTRQDTTWAPVVPPESRWSWQQLAIAATILLVLGLSAYFIDQQFFAAPAGMRARVQSAQGGIYLVSDNAERRLRPGDELRQGQLIRTAGGAHAFVQLRDGSVVEMNERTEFSVDMSRKDTTVNLGQGRIIVQAAHRSSGHLYVLTPDARVAVTGTVFSVNAAIKGSRVAVIQGEVHVLHAGLKDILHPGDQVATSASIREVAVQDEISWSQNLDKHLALLAQFAKLQHKFEQIPTPGLRYSSAIFSQVPADTMVYASIPNLGEALSEGNRIFQEQLQQSAVLREWWDSGKRPRDGGLTFEQMVEKVHSLSQYIGDEVVMLAVPGQMGEADAVVMAEVRRPGLSDFLQSEFTNVRGQGETPDFRVVDQSQLASLPENTTKGQLLALVRSDFVFFSPNPRSLQRIASQLGAGGFPSTEFGKAVGQAYSQGAGFLLAVNLQQLIAQQDMKAVRNQNQRSRQQLALTGFHDARFLVAQHREVSGVPDNRAVVDFTGQRHGIASWLASPAPMGSLDYVSPNAGMAVAFVAKSPVMMFDDLLQIGTASGRDPQRNLADAESKLGISLRDDLAACFGGDITFALDGPILPKPSWKVIAQVNDPVRLQNTLERLAQAATKEATEHGRPGVQISQEQSDGRVFYTVRSLDPRRMNSEVDYTFADGYLILAPSRPLVIAALRTKQNNDSLVRSAGFQSLLPRDQHANFSALFYQNLAPVVEPIASQLTASQLQALQEIAGEAKPTVICAYGEPSSIEVASASRLFPFNLNQMTLSALFGGHSHRN